MGCIQSPLTAIARVKFVKRRGTVVPAGAACRLGRYGYIQYVLTKRGTVQTHGRLSEEGYLMSPEGPHAEAVRALVDFGLVTKEEEALHMSWLQAVLAVSAHMVKLNRLYDLLEEFKVGLKPKSLTWATKTLDALNKEKTAWALRAQALNGKRAERDAVEAILPSVSKK